MLRARNPARRLPGKFSEFGEFECDDSYFGVKRVHGKRVRGAPVFGLLKRGEKVYVRVVDSCSRESLMPIIQGLTLSGSTIYTDGWRAYDGLILNGYEHHRVSLETSLRNTTARTSSRMARATSTEYGCDSDKFVLYLRECAWGGTATIVRICSHWLKSCSALRNFLNKDTSQAFFRNIF